MLPEISLVVASLILVWLLILTLLIVRIFLRYYRLTKGSAKKDLGAIIENILKENKIKSNEIKGLRKRLGETEKRAIGHIQKIGLVRFNPFTEMGGNQSFALAVLDGEDSGIVISGLHGRDSTRLYTKMIKKGKAVKLEFSKEEKEAIKKAMKQ